MSRPNANRSGSRRQLAAIAALLTALLIATELQAIVHRHGDVWSRDGQLAAAAHSGADPERPCSICRLADSSSLSLAEPAGVVAACVVPDVPPAQAAVRPATGSEPVRSTRAPPRPASC